MATAKTSMLNTGVKTWSELLTGPGTTEVYNRIAQDYFEARDGVAKPAEKPRDLPETVSQGDDIW